MHTIYAHYIHTLFTCTHICIHAHILVELLFYNSIDTTINLIRHIYCQFYIYIYIYIYIKFNDKVEKCSEDVAYILLFPKGDYLMP